MLSAIRENPLRAAAVGHNVHGYKLTAFVIAAAYAGFAGGLLGVMQAFMPPDAFMFQTSAQLVMQTVIGGVGTLFGPLLYQRWQAARGGRIGGPGPGGPGSRTRSGLMSRAEAFEVLGLQPGVSEAEIREAHRRLMRGAHPDTGGSDWLAARINQARDILLG